MEESDFCYVFWNLLGTQEYKMQEEKKQET